MKILVAKTGNVVGKQFASSCDKLDPMSRKFLKLGITVSPEILLSLQIRQALCNARSVSKMQHIQPHVYVPFLQAQATYQLKEIQEGGDGVR